MIHKRSLKVNSGTHDTHSFCDGCWEVSCMRTHLLVRPSGGYEGSLQQFSHHSGIAVVRSPRQC
jgi:hypothetical protein